MARIQSGFEVENGGGFATMVGFHLSCSKWNSIANPSSSFPSIISATLTASSSIKPPWSTLQTPTINLTEPSLTLNPSSVSLSSRPELSLNPCSLISKTLSNELHGYPSQAHPLTSTLPPQAASLHQTLTEPSLNLSSLSLISETLSGQASLELPRSPISNHQPPPLHGGSSALCVSA